ncbi:MAG: hypothetical protein HC802_07695, partial [Caldilineaceae bacterium]|nr:hypothetical protein [Caldilineaceae bacterium]
LTDWRGRPRGEALLAAPGVPAITFGQANGNGAVLVREIEASVEAIFDPLATVSATTPPDPDDLEARREQLPRSSEAVMISAGKSVSVRIAVALP